MSIPEPIREELDQTPGWWDRQYQALISGHASRAPANHEGHEIVEDRRYLSPTVTRYCIPCGLQLDPYEET